MSPWEQFLEAWYRVRGWYPVRMRGRDFRCDPDHISFWSKVSAGAWEPQTFEVLDSILKPGGVHLDIGAWIGPTVLHASLRSQQVFCLEPDRVAYMYLLANLKLNRLENVVPFNLAVAAEGSLARMASPRGKRGDSMSSLLLPDGNAGQDVVVAGWQQWLDLAGEPVFSSIKMDIEGGEFELLPAMAEYLQYHRPALYLSLHPHLLPEAERGWKMAALVELLTPIYRTILNKAGERLGAGRLLAEETVHGAGSWLLLAG